MKKFLLVTIVGMVLIMNMYGFIEYFTNEMVEEIDHIEETTITVYVE